MCPPYKTTGTAAASLEDALANGRRRGCRCERCTAPSRRSAQSRAAMSDHFPTTEILQQWSAENCLEVDFGCEQETSVRSL